MRKILEDANRSLAISLGLGITATSLMLRLTYPINQLQSGRMNSMRPFDWQETRATNPLTLGLDRSVLLCNRKRWRSGFRLRVANAGLLIRQLTVNEISESNISDAVLLNGLQVSGGPPLRPFHAHFFDRN
jgi:hypothetical protein